MGYRIFMRCLGQVLRNWLAALKLSWLWMVILALAWVGFIAVSVASKQSAPDGGNVGFIAGVLLLIVLALLAFATIAVGWHRYVLREEQIGWFIFLKSDWPIGPYIWKSLKITLVIVIPASIIAFLVGMFSYMLLGVSEEASLNLTAQVVLFLVNTLLSVGITWIFYRIGVGLPAAALGESKMSILDSLRITRDMGEAIFVAAFMSVVLNLLPQLLVLLVDAAFGLTWLTGLAALTVIPVGFISAFVGIGILTVLYGHLVEGRPV